MDNNERYEQAGYFTKEICDLALAWKYLCEAYPGAADELPETRAIRNRMRVLLDIAERR